MGWLAGWSCFRASYSEALPLGLLNYYYQLYASIDINHNYPMREIRRSIYADVGSGGRLHIIHKRVAALHHHQKIAHEKLIKNVDLHYAWDLIQATLNCCWKLCLCPSRLRPSLVLLLLLFIVVAHC